MRKRKGEESVDAASAAKKNKTDGAKERPAIYSDADFTNYFRWTLASAAETKSCWFNLISDDKKTRHILLLDAAKFKTEHLYEPKVVPPEYTEQVGTVLYKQHSKWLQRKRDEPWFAHYGIVIEECTAAFLPDQLGPSHTGAMLNIPDRFWTEGAMKSLLRGEQPDNVVPVTPGTLTVSAARAGDLLKINLSA